MGQALKSSVIVDRGSILRQREFDSHTLLQNSHTAMLTVIPSAQLALVLAIVPVPILDHLSTLPASFGLTIKGKLLDFLVQAP